MGSLGTTKMSDELIYAPGFIIYRLDQKVMNRDGCAKQVELYVYMSVMV